MRALALGLVAGVFLSLSGYAEQMEPLSGRLDTLDVTAPSFFGTSNIASPSVGSVIFDISVNKFKGYSSTGLWQTLTQNPSVVSVTTGYGITSADDVVLASGGPFSITLPDASVAANKKLFRFKKTDATSANVITIATTGGQSIGFGTASPTSVILNMQGEQYDFVSDGLHWQVVDYGCPPIVAVASGLASGTYTASTPLQYNTVQIDSASGVTTGASWKYTAIKAGYYSVSIGGQQASAGANAVDFGIFKNGTVSYSSTKNSSVGSLGSNTYQGFWGGGSAIVSLAKGDYIDVRPTSSVPVAAGGVITITYLKPM